MEVATIFTSDVFSLKTAVMWLRHVETCWYQFEFSVATCSDFFHGVEGSEMVLPKMSGMVSTLMAQETPCQTLTCNARPYFRWWEAFRF